MLLLTTAVGSVDRIRVGTRGRLLRPAAGLILVTALAVTAAAAVARGGVAAAVAFAIIGGLAAILLIARLGFAAVILWVVVTGVATPFLRYPQQHAVITFDRAWIALLAIALIGGVANPPKSRATIWMAGALGLLVVSFGLRAYFTHQAQRYSVELWLDAILLPALLYSVARRRTNSVVQLQRLAGGFAIAGVLIGLVAVAERVVGFELATRSGGAVVSETAVGVRYSGPFAQPDMLAVVLLICLAMTLFWMQLRGSSVLLAGLVAVAVELAGIWLTYFRGAWIAAVVVFVISLGLRPRNYGRLAGFAALAAIVGVVAFSQLSDSSGGLATRVNNTRNLAGRLATYEQGLRLFEEHPLFGVGISQFGVSEQATEAVRVEGVRAVSTAHNSFVDVLAEQGLVGLIPLLLLSLAVWNLVHQVSRRARLRSEVLLAATVAAATLAYLIMAMEETTVVQNAPNAFLAVCLGMAAAFLDRESGKSPHYPTAYATKGASSREASAAST